jgi:hypothetical protein
MPALRLVADARGAADASALRYHHPWGRCGVGSSQTFRTVTENFNDQGQVTEVTITETQTTLKSINPDGVTLRIDVVREMGANRVNWQPQEIRQSFSGAMPNQAANVKKLPPVVVNIDGKDTQCEQDEIELLGQGEKRICRICYNQQSPLILKRTIETTDLNHAVAGGGNSLSQTQVIELDMPCKVLSEIKTGSLMRTSLSGPNGSTTTLTWNVSDVPGELVESKSKKTDAQGRLVRLSVTELKAYRLEPLAQPEAAQWIPRRHRRAR